jgi:hypothetical protein
VGESFGKDERHHWAVSLDLAIQLRLGHSMIIDSLIHNLRQTSNAGLDTLKR